MSTIFEKNSNQALIGKIEKLAKKYNPANAKNKEFKLNNHINDALENLGFDNNYNVKTDNLNIDAFINNALAVGFAPDAAKANAAYAAADDNAAGDDTTPTTAPNNKPRFYQDLKDILIDSTLEDLKSIRKFQKISGNELKNLESLEKTLNSFKKNNAGNLDSIMIFRNEISEITGSLKLNITALQNFDKNEVKLANLLEESENQITREELAENIEFENERLDGLSRGFKNIEKDLKTNDTNSIETYIEFSKNSSAKKIFDNEKTRPKKIFDNEKTRPSNNKTEKILSNAKQFEKAKWNTKGVIGMLVAFLSGLFKPALGEVRLKSAKKNFAIVKNYDKTMKDMKEILKEYAKLSRQFENLEREYANAGVTDTDKEKQNVNKTKFNEISNRLKAEIKYFSDKYKEIETVEQKIKDKKEEIKREDIKSTKENNEGSLNLKVLKLQKNQFFQEFSTISSDKKDEKGNVVKKNKEDVKISALEALKDELKFANKDFEKQNKEFQKSEHRNAGLIQKASDALFGFSDKGKAKEETKKLTTKLDLKGSQKIIDGKSADITLR